MTAFGNCPARPELDALLKDAATRYAAMSPLEKAILHTEQARGWVRGETGIDPGENVLVAEITALRHDLDRARAALNAAVSEYDDGFEAGRVQTIERCAQIVLAHKPDASFDDSAAGAVERSALLANLAREVRGREALTIMSERQGDLSGANPETDPRIGGERASTVQYRGSDTSPILAEVVRVLDMAAGWFDDYERQHRAKTPPDTMKADTNAGRAFYLRAAIRRLKAMGIGHD